MSVLMWLWPFFFLPFQYGKKSSEAFIKGGFLIIPNERNNIISPLLLRLGRGLEARESQVLVVLRYGRALVVVLRTWGEPEA